MGGSELSGEKLYTVTRNGPKFTVVCVQCGEWTRTTLSSKTCELQVTEHLKKCAPVVPPTFAEMYGPDFAWLSDYETQTTGVYEARCLHCHIIIKRRRFDEGSWEDDRSIESMRREIQSHVVNRHYRCPPQPEPVTKAHVRRDVNAPPPF